MIIVSVGEPIYSKADNSQIDCEVTFDDGKTYLYTANAMDATNYGIQLWAELNNGVHGAIAPYVIP